MDIILYRSAAILEFPEFLHAVAIFAVKCNVEGETLFGIGDPWPWLISKH